MPLQGIPPRWGLRWEECGWKCHGAEARSCEPEWDPGTGRGSVGRLARQHCRLRGGHSSETHLSVTCGGSIASSQPRGPRLGSPLCPEHQQSQDGSLTLKEQDAQGWETHSLWGAQGGGPGSTPKGRAGGPQGPISEPGLAVAAELNSKGQFWELNPKTSTRREKPRPSVWILTS